MRTEKATFGAGCFWHVELKFSELSIKTEVGFMVGKTKKPSYKEVCTGKTGHTEVVQIIFDPKKVSYKKLIETFWQIHNPTQLNRQGFDFGTQYRSVIFYHNEKQKNQAEKSKKEFQKYFKKPIVTEIKEFSKFYKAEEYHQKYLEKKSAKTC